jgi:transposase
VLVDRRRCLGEEHTRKVAQLHALLLELIPGGAKVFLSAAQARKLLASVRPRDGVGKTRKRVATELVKATGTGLLDLHGIGPSGAARLLVEVGDITRFPDCGHFASWTGTAPIDASSGDHVRHRLSRGGNRQINRVLHIMAVVQLRNPTEGRDYFDRKKASGKTSMEAMRCLKRRLSDLVYKTMLDDLVTAQKTGPGGQPGNDSVSSVTGSQPTAGSSDKSLPGPAKTKPKRTLPAAS